MHRLFRDPVGPVRLQLFRLVDFNRWLFRTDPKLKHS